MITFAHTGKPHAIKIIALIQYYVNHCRAAHMYGNLVK